MNQLSGKIGLRLAWSKRTVTKYSFKILPENHFINWQQDPFGNYQARVVFPEKTTELSVEVEVIARLQVINPFDFFVEDYAQKFPFKYDSITLVPSKWLSLSSILYIWPLTQTLNLKEIVCTD